MLCIRVTICESVPCNHNFSNEASEASWDAEETPYGFTNSATIKAIKVALILDQLRRMMEIKKKTIREQFEYYCGLVLLCSLCMPSKCALSDKHQWQKKHHTYGNQSDSSKLK